MLRGAGLIPGRGTKIPHTSWPKNPNKKQKQHCNKFHKDFKDGPHQKYVIKERDCNGHYTVLISFWTQISPRPLAFAKDM